jgi:hypothetical protein
MSANDPINTFDGATTWYDTVDAPVHDYWYGPLLIGSDAGIIVPGDNNMGGLLTDTFQPHTVIIVGENVDANTTFEFEVTRHYEGTPSDDSRSLELREATLANYSNTLELIRKASDN